MAAEQGKIIVTSLEATDLGKSGEQLGLDYLLQQHYQLLQHNYRCAHGEIDLIMQEGEQLVFVEVKLRHHEGLIPAENALTKPQIRRIAKAAMLYISSELGHEVDCRFDLITIDFNDGFYKLTHTKSLVPLGDYLD